MSSQIIIYTGNHTGPFVTKALLMQLKNLIDDRIHTLTEVKNLREGWNQPFSIKAYVVPGGNGVCLASLPEAPEWKENVRSHHIPYLGICAGGILMCRELQETFTPHPERTKITLFQKPSPMEGLLDLDVIAPLFPKPYPDYSLNDFRIIPTTFTQESKVSSIAIPHILSPGFIPPDNLQNVEILSTYSPQPSILIPQGHLLKSLPPLASAIYVERGEFKAKTLLTGFHAEIGSKAVQLDQFRASFKATASEQMETSQQLEIDDVAREALFKGYLEKLGISCKPS